MYVTKLEFVYKRPSTAFVPVQRLEPRLMTGGQWTGHIGEHIETSRKNLRQNLCQMTVAGPAGPPPSFGTYLARVIVRFSYIFTDQTCPVIARHEPGLASCEVCCQVQAVTWISPPREY